jgi:hypothetical protein
MRKRILVVLVAVVMALTMVAAPVSAHSGSYQDSNYKNGPWCHWYPGYGYEVVWGQSHYYHGDYRAQRYYDDYGDLHYSCRYLYDNYDGGYDGGYYY